MAIWLRQSLLAASLLAMAAASHESGEGFESAVAYAVAERMGFDKSAVDWVRTSFDEAIQPGVKNFDFNLQQYSIKPERLEVIDFSTPYYTTTMAVVVKDGSAAASTDATASSLKKLKFGAAAGTTSQPFLAKVLQPEQDLLLYDDNADVVAAISLRCLSLRCNWMVESSSGSFR